MAELDLFDLTGLSFDPPEKSTRKVKAAIDKKIKDLGTSLTNESQQIKRNEITARMEFLKAVSEKIIASDGKKLNEGEYLALASQRVDSELKRLKSTALLMSQAGSSIISEGMIKFHRKERKLSEENVRKVFMDLGFSIVDIDPLAAMPTFPKNAERTHSEIVALGRTKDPNPNGADTSVVTDLYAFAAYLEGEPENAALYRSKTTAELLGLFDSHAKRFAMRNDDLGKLCASLSTAAKTYVFNSDENRQAYENFLKYKSPSLTALFESMQGASKADLLDVKFAEPCIKRISEVFGNYDTALAIYNREAGLKDDPYIPLKPVYHIKCEYCGQVSEFPSEEDAQKANQCTNCKKELFKKCSKCGKLIPVSRDKCPHCGFFFAGAVLFEKHYRTAEAALRKSDFEAARKHLYDAQSADPGESRRVEQLLSKIEAEEKKYAQPINKLRELITGKKFAAARQVLYETIKQYPGLNVSAYEVQIQNASTKADTRYEASQKLPPERQADECVAILHDYVDHQPALDFLRTHPPLPCKSLSVAADAHGISVSWGNSGEMGVSYRLERSAKNQGGESRVLQDRSVSTSYVDQSAKPGIQYTYTVYAIRSGVSSEPVSKSMVLHAEVDNFHITQNRDCVRLTWDAPDNSVGAMVTRIMDGKSTVLSKNAYGSLEDRDVCFGTAYTYRIQANYPDSLCSHGIESVITPLLIIDSFRIKVAAVKDNVFKVSWDIRQPGVDLKIMANEKIVLECKSDDGGAQVKLPGETFNIVKVMAYSGGAWVSSDNSAEINTYTSCSIDRNRTELREESISTPQGIWCNIVIKIKMAESMPGNVLGFYYAVRTTSDASRWATIGDIGKSPDIRRISAENYNIKNEIAYTETVKDETAFYVSVFTIYNVEGKEVVSEPKTLRLDRPVFADLFWKVSKSIWGGTKLLIDISANRPLDRIPELALCACYENEFITSYDDSHSIVLKQFSEVDLETPQKLISRTYDVDCSYSGKELKRMKLFLFETDPIRSEKFTLRWQQGFMGKV